MCRMGDIIGIQVYIFVLSYSSLLQHDRIFQQDPRIRKLGKLPLSSNSQVLLMILPNPIANALIAQIPFHSFHFH